MFAKHLHNSKCHWSKKQQTHQHKDQAEDKKEKKPLHDIWLKTCFQKGKMDSIIQDSHSDPV